MFRKFWCFLTLGGFACCWNTCSLFPGPLSSIDVRVFSLLKTENFTNQNAGEIWVVFQTRLKTWFLTAVFVGVFYVYSMASFAGNPHLTKTNSFFCNFRSASMCCETLDGTIRRQLGEKHVGALNLGGLFGWEPFAKDNIYGLNIRDHLYI